MVIDETKKVGYIGLMTNLKEKRLEDFKITQLFPINILVENKKKNLSISLNMFKICRLFPKEEIGHMKKIQKEFEKENVSKMCYNKTFSNLTEIETIEVKKYLNKRASTPSRTSPYIKFLVKSFILTNFNDVKFSTFEEEINESWCFTVGGKKFDITTNEIKKSDDCLYFNSSEILDSNGLVKENCIKYINSVLPFQFNLSVIVESNDCVNKLRNQFIAVYDVKSEENELNLFEESTSHKQLRSS